LGDHVASCYVHTWMASERDLSGARAPSLRPFVGRDAEMEQLEAAFEEALAGRGRLFLVTGEPGIGKSRLADELSRRMRARAGIVAWGRSWEAGGAPAYWPFLDPLSTLVDALDDGELLRALGEGAGAAAALVPAISSRLPDGPVSVSADPEQARFRLFRALTGLVRRAAAPGGALLVLEDLHAADESSLRLLHFLARELVNLRVLVIATLRDADAEISAPATALLGQIEREATPLWLGRLTASDVEGFVRARSESADATVVQQLFRRSQGHPLFLEQLVNLLAKRGPEAVLSAALPSGVRDAIRERLARAPVLARETLELGAVIGDEMDPVLMSAALGVPLSDVLEQLDAAARAGAVTAHEVPRVRFRFSHALVREVLVQELAPERAALLHSRVADATLARATPGLEPPHAELAHHLLRSGPDRTGVAVFHAIEAAERALSLFAFEDAGRLLEQAQAAVEGPGARLGDEKIRVLTALGRVRIKSGAGSTGRALCLQACAVARELGNAEAFARAALAYGLELTAALIDPTLVALLQEASSLLPAGDSALGAQVSARLAAAMQPHSDPKIPIALAERAIASARRLGGKDTLLGALFTGMSAMMDIVDPNERLPLNLEIEQLALSLGEPEVLLRTQARLAFDHMELADFAAADLRIQQFERLGTEYRAERYLWRVPLFHSMRAMIHGRFEEAEAACARARELGLAARDPQLERCWVFHREGLLRAWERHGDMRALDLEARRMRAALYSGQHWQNGGSAFTSSRLEDRPSTRLYLELLPFDDWPLVQNPAAFLHLGEPLALTGNPEPVRLVYELLLLGRHRSISWGYTAFLWEGPATRVLGLLAARLGLVDEARAHFQHALDLLTRVEAGPLHARCLYEYGRFLLDAGAETEGTDAVVRAQGEAEALGLSGLVQLAEARLSPRPRPPRAAASHEQARAGAALPFTFAPEGEFWTVSYEATTFRLRDSLGLQYLARLFAEPGRPIHVLELSGATDSEGVIDLGDGGELIDEAARVAYKGRLVELRTELEEAESYADQGRAERAREQIEYLTAELARAVGLGGRARRAGGATERARSAVQRRIKNAIDRVRESSPALGALLERRVRTGIHCSYNQDPPPAE